MQERMRDDSVKYSVKSPYPTRVPCRKTTEMIHFFVWPDSKSGIFRGFPSVVESYHEHGIDFALRPQRGSYGGWPYPEVLGSE
jgi:hypothetical protein